MKKKHRAQAKRSTKLLSFVTFTALVAALLWPIPVNYFLLTCKPTSAQQHCPTNERFIVYISVSAFSFLRNKQTSKNSSKKALQSMKRCPFLVWFVHWSTADTEWHCDDAIHRTTHISSLHSIPRQIVTIQNAVQKLLTVRFGVGGAEFALGGLL